jgi:hypothetical protein
MSCSRLFRVSAVREALRSPRTGALILWSFDREVPAGGAVSVVELQRQVLLVLVSLQVLVSASATESAA